MFRQKSKCDRRSQQALSTPKPISTEDFTFLSPQSNLDIYPLTDQAPYAITERLPTMTDVIEIRQLLTSKMPIEIVDLVIDFAGCWPHTTSTLDMTTRIYHDHMQYGSYNRDPKNTGKQTPAPETKREWRDKGFILRTPPMGIPCAQLDTSPPKRKSSRRSATLLNQSGHQPSARTKGSKNPLPTWLPPRGAHPARAILFEILSREERPTNYQSGYRTDPATSFEVSIDSMRIPQPPPSPSFSLPSTPPLPYFTPWTTAAATTPSYIPNPFPLHPTPSFSPRQSLASTSPLVQIQQQYQPLFLHENRSAQNRKVVVAFRYGERTPQLSSKAVGGFLGKLSEGDCITLWGRAWEGQGPCVNVVERVKVHVFWAV